jgi:hypothetical protein
MLERMLLHLETVCLAIRKLAAPLFQIADGAGVAAIHQ